MSEISRYFNTADDAEFPSHSYSPSSLRLYLHHYFAENFNVTTPLRISCQRNYFLLADIAHLTGKTLVSAAILRFEGQISTFKSHLGEPYPCYRCLFPEAPADGLVPSCSEGGVLGAVAGIMGSLQAIEIIKEIIGIGESLAGQLLLFNALETTFSKIKLSKDPECGLCGNKSRNNDLSC